MNNNNENENKISAAHVLLQIIILAALIGAGTTVYFYFIKNKPEVKKHGKKKPRPVYVDIIELKKESADIVVDAMGEVEPEKSIELNSSVSGEITEISKDFYPGGIIKKGDIILQIDKKDYELKVEKNISLVKMAKASLDLELGQQKSAAKELELYEKSGMDIINNKSLALRTPQLESAKAEHESALSELKQAKLNLERTTIKAPFDAIIVETSVNLGSYISSQQSLATLYGTEKFRIKASVPSDRVEKLMQNKDNAEVIIASQTSDTKRKGYLKSITGKILENSRMAEVLVEVDDPMGLKSKLSPILSGDYVSIKIKAESIKNIISIPREYVHDNKYVWIFENGKLKIRAIKILWKDSKNILVKEGVSTGEKLITSAISIPVKDMPLVVEGRKNQIKKSLEKKNGNKKR